MSSVVVNARNYCLPSAFFENTWDTTVQISFAHIVLWMMTHRSAVSPVLIHLLLTSTIVTVNCAHLPVPNRNATTVPKVKLIWIDTSKSTITRCGIVARYLLNVIFKYDPELYTFNEKILKVSGCGFTSKTSATLQKHVRKIHEGLIAPQYGCHICQQRFQCSNSLKRHLGNMHQVVPLCGAGRFK